MKIIHLAAGAGGLYCGSCSQANTLVAAMRAAGHDALLAPLYTPLVTDEENVSIDRLAMAGPSVALAQYSALGRHAPRLFDRLLASSRLTGWLGRLAGQTRPERLGPLTVSMLRGEEGNQRKEVDKLVAWLDTEIQPEVVHLSTALLVGAARTIHERLGVPVVATLAGEDSFIERLPEPHCSEAREEFRARCAELAALVAPSGYYAEFMASYLGMPSERITVIRPGLNLEGCGQAGWLAPSEEAAQSQAAEEQGMPADESPAEPASFPPMGPLRTPPLPHGRGSDLGSPAEESVRIGFFSRICPAKGLHQLAEAFAILLKTPNLPPLRLVAAGCLDRGDRAYLRQVRRWLDRRGLADRFTYCGRLDRAGKIAFLRSLDVLSIPTTRSECRGLAVLEGWANGTPTVLPDHGVFSELTAETGGGLLFEPNRPTKLAAALARLVAEPGLAEQMGRKAQGVVHGNYDIRSTAERMMGLYRTLRRI